MALFDYDRDELKPSIISAHGLKQEVLSGASRKLNQKSKNAQVLQNVASNIYKYGSGGNANTPDIELRTDKFTNLNIDSGETLEILSKKGAGLLHTLEVVLDNPYGAVYLEVDGYKNTADGIGETPAELLLNNRTTRVDGQFWVKTVATDGTFTMMYTPQKPEPYTEQLKVMVSNRIKPSRDVFGHSLNYTSRGGIPTPIKTDFMGGGFYSHTGLKEASLSTIEKAIAKPVGSSVYSVDDTYNQSVFDSNNRLLGTGHPYQGQAGKPTLTKNSDFDGTIATIEFATVATVGADANAVPGPTLAGSANFPGTPATPSYQNIFIYNDASKDVTEVATLNFDEATGVLLNETSISADAQTTLTVDTVDPTTKFTVGDVLLDDAGQRVGIIQNINSNYDANGDFTTGVITLTANNIVAVAENENLRRKTPTIPKIGDRMFLRNKGSVYFPGIVQNVFRYSRTADSGGAGANAWVDETNAKYGGATGAHCFQVYPGLRASASVFTKTSDGSDDTISIGTVTTNADSNPKIYVKSLFIKRQIVVGSES